MAVGSRVEGRSLLYLIDSLGVQYEKRRSIETFAKAAVGSSSGID